MNTKYHMYHKVLGLCAVAALLFTSGATLAADVSLTAAASTTVLPDGQSVPMWGYTCNGASGASCAPLNAGIAIGGTDWSPVVITVPPGPLTINLTNNLPISVPTSLTIVGQLGGGLGDPKARTTTASPEHPSQGTTWPTVDNTTTFQPPAQGPRVQSFATEVANGATTSLTWNSLKPGTYLIESGTHPSIQGPMGLYSVLVVTNAPINSTTLGTAYPNISYGAELALLMSEIDPVQNKAVADAVNTVGFDESAVHSLQLGTLSSISVSGGGSGYTSPPLVTISGGGGTGATATAIVSGGTVTGFLITNHGARYTSTPDVTIAGGNGTGATATASVSLTSTAGSQLCSNNAPACYPPAVNYDPRYYLINGKSFDRTNAATNYFAATPNAPAAGGVLLRMVNAGLRSHTPSFTGTLTGNAMQGVTLLAEDGNVLPGTPKIQNEVFLAAGKTYDVSINSDGLAHAIFDRQLSLSTNNARDGGQLAYFGMVPLPTTSGSGLTVAGTSGAINSTGLIDAGVTATATADTFYLLANQTQPLIVSDAASGVLANDKGIYGVKVQTAPLSAAQFNLNSDGTFLYKPTDLVSPVADSFTYCGNSATSSSACTTVTLANCTTGNQCLGGAPVANADSFTGNVATRLQIAPPGILTNDTDPQGHPLTAVADTTCSAPAGASLLSSNQLTLNTDGSFTANASSGNYYFCYHAVNSQGTASPATTAQVSLPAASNLTVNLFDVDDKTPITDYRWIIEEDRTVLIKPNSTSNTGGMPVPNLGTNFHTSFMPVVAQGCVGTVSCENGQSLMGAPAVCDIGNGKCRTDAAQKKALDPKDVHLDSSKRYYISIMPGDGVSTNAAGTGHGMGGAQIAAGQTSVNINLQKTPYDTAQISVFIFEDDNPLNGENDAGGGVDILAPNEPGLGGFAITLLDAAGGLGDSTGQITYDMFNNPVSNSLAGTIDPATGRDACPISKAGTAASPSDGLVGMIITCPTYEAGVDANGQRTLSPLAGQALIKNLYPGLYEVQATASAERLSAGEEWWQTSTLDGTKPIEAFIKAGEPTYFQEFGPAGYHVAVGFANPKIINNRKLGLCTGSACPATVTGQVTNTRLSRVPDMRVYSSGNGDHYSFTTCFVSMGPPDGEDFAFTKCDANGKFSFSGVPTGNYRLTVFDQWNDMTVDGLSTPIVVDAKAGNLLNATNTNCTGSPSAPTCNYEIAVTQWRTNLYTRTFLDKNGDGVSQSESEPGLPLVSTNVRYRDGSIGFFNSTDLSGHAIFNEVFPFLNWLVAETDSTRYKQTGIHVVYDAGGAVDGTTGGGHSVIADHLANTVESPTAHLPIDLRVPGAKYCNSADCPNPGDFSDPSSGQPGSTGRVDPGWVASEAWAGLLGQNSFLEFGMKPFAEAPKNADGTPKLDATGKPIPAENGGIKGHVIYSSTRPFDDPSRLLQLSWEPGVANVKVNLYQENTAKDGSKTLKLVDTTTSTSFDDWAQGFHPGADGQTPMPNMSCPGQETTSPFFFTLQNSTHWLNPNTPIAHNSQFKCYDGWSMLNQLQPAPYDGMYKFPSIVGRDPATGAPIGTGTAVNGTGGALAGSNCTICIANPDDGTPMLPAGKYVVEVSVPPGYELVKEEDKNILLGDAYNAPVTQQFLGFGNIFILPDQATLANANPYNTQNPTTDLGAPPAPKHEGDTGSVESFWPCVGANRIVPDYNSLFPGAQQVAPFAGATRPLCDRKEVVLEDQSSVLAKFYIFSSTHIAGHFTGTITNDFASEFDPFSPQFGEKFAPANLPVSLRDSAGNEVSRAYSDQWGLFNGLNYSTWSVNPPNPTGYIPQMMVACMNDPGPISDPAHPGQIIPDPNFNPAYSNFCYEKPFMPGQTDYMDTPVTPTQAFADQYNLPDCAYTDATPAIKEVHGDNGVGPWVASGTGHSLTITALGDQQVINAAYSGPNATSSPYNQKYITRHYGFGASQGSGSVTIGGVNATVSSWSDASITVNVPNLPNELNATTGVGSTCGTGSNQTPFQRTSPANIGTSARCGELVITAGNGKKSVDTVTVTIGGKPPIYVAAGQSIQAAIDAASPGDLIIVPPGSYNEMVVMWKPVRLQGVGAASAIINASAHPAGKLLEPWRQKVGALFGLNANGRPGGAIQVDRIPFEAIVGWDTSGNGNLAQVLIEPTLMGAYEGAGITVLGRGIRQTDLSDPLGANNAGGFSAGSVYLTASNLDCRNPSTGVGGDYYTSNFNCNPSRIDGLSVINSSQGGGGIFLHAWAHHIEVSNNRVYSNQGTLTGGIIVGNGEFPDPNIADGGTLSTNPFLVPERVTQPNGTVSNAPLGTQLGYGYNTFVKVHHNAVTSNASLGDALFSGTPSAAGGITVSPGSDNSQVSSNWVCGNLSTGDGGGIAHVGFSNDVTIDHNTIVFNQSQNTTIPTHGGGLAVLGASPDRTLATGIECGNTTADTDCPPGLAEGTGRNLLIDSNLIMGNSAESGSGGGLRLQLVNGQEVVAFPRGPNFSASGSNASPGWNNVTVTNNIIANNVAGWDGGGVSLQDALKVKFINNTVISNDTTASAGVLFNTLGAPLSSTPPPGCDPSVDPTCNGGNSVPTSTPQTSGLVTMTNTPNLTVPLTGVTLTCPSGYGYGTGGNAATACKSVSLPQLTNNIFYQNRAFKISVTGLGSNQQNQQHIVTLEPTLQQLTTGFCQTVGINNTGNVNYLDLGVRDASAQGNLAYANLVANSNLTSATNPQVISQYCNGARIPPEHCNSVSDPLEKARCLGFNAPAGRSEFTGLGPVFNLSGITPAATVDEGNNWINLTFGPLTTVNPLSSVILGNYAINGNSPAINAGAAIVTSGATGTPSAARDFFGTSRPQGRGFDIGAVEFVGIATGPIPIASVTGGPLNFGSTVQGTTTASQTLTLHNTGNANLTGINLAFSSPRFSRPAGAAGGTCGNSLTPATGICTINVVFSPNAVGPLNATLTINANVSVTGSPVALSGTGLARLSFNPLALVFPTTARGATSATQFATLTVPAGYPALTGVTFPFSSANFQRSTTSPGTCGTTIASPSTCTIGMVFTPAAAPASTGLKGGTMTISNTAGVAGPALPEILTGIAN